MLRLKPPTKTKALLSFSLAAFILAVSASSAFAQQQLSPEQEEVQKHLPAGTVASDPQDGQTLATNEQLAEATRAAIAHAQGGAHPEFTAVELTAAGIQLRPSAVPVITERAVEQLFQDPDNSDVTSLSQVVETAFLNSPIASPEIKDKPAVAAAIVAAAICGAEDATAGQTFGQFKPLLKQIVQAAVVAANTANNSVGNTASGDFRIQISSDPRLNKNFDQIPGTSDTADDNLINSTGAAGVVTGAVSQVTGFSNNGRDTTTDVNKLVKTVVRTAVRFAPTQFLHIAQAAATAAASVYNQTSGLNGYKPTTIKSAVIAGLQAAGKAVTPGKVAKIVLVIKFGITQANAGLNGAGAQGVANYAHNNCNGNAVTDVTGF